MKETTDIANMKGMRNTSNTTTMSSKQELTLCDVTSTGILVAAASGSHRNIFCGRPGANLNYLMMKSMKKKTTNTIAS